MNEWPASNVEMVSVADLVPYARNSRTHSDEQVDQIAASIREWGWTIPILIDEHGGMITGHGRILAAHKLRIEKVPAMIAKGWSDAQKKAYIIADNKLPLNAGWDDEMLRIELGDLADLDFDLSMIGFDKYELAEIMFDDDSEAALPDLAEGDGDPFQQKTFTLHDDQASIVDDAVTLARTNPLADTGINENANGNAISLICKQWLEAQNG